MKEVAPFSEVCMNIRIYGDDTRWIEIREIYGNLRKSVEKFQSSFKWTKISGTLHDILSSYSYMVEKWKK